MKKILYSVLALAMTAFTFTSCEDVPAPYGIPEGGQGGQDLPEGVYIDQDFTSSLGGFTSVSESGTLEWYNDFKSAMCTGYQDFNGDGEKENQAGVTWLVSPEIDLTEAQKAYISVNMAMRYERGDINENNSILISKNYTGNVNTATWEQLTYNTDDLNGTEFVFTEKSMNIPADYLGGKVVVAFRHTCTETYSSTWEVKSILIQEGEVEEGGDEPDVPITGENLLENGDFETWSSTSQPDNWKSTTTASSATLKQSTDAHGGNYSVLVTGSTSSNKRLAYKEITLKAGTYQMSFYAKAVENEGTVNIGYVPVVNGKVGDYQYKTNGYTDLSDTEWTEVTNTFTLDATTTVNLVVMNAKSPGKDVLVDDFSLTTNDGGLTDEQPEEPVVTTGTYALTTSITSGSKFVIATPSSGNTYVVAQALSSSSTYGYLQVEDVTVNNNTLETSEDNEFTITEVSGGYTIQDKSGRYYYMTGTFNSFNVSDNMPSSGAVFDITFNSDNTVSIKNVEMKKTLQFSEEYNSYGIYTDVTMPLPYLFVKK